jgi:hypothetical protein
MAEMLGYSSVEEMQKAFDESIPDEPVCDQCGVDCQDPEKGKKFKCDTFKSDYDIDMEEEAKWVKEHPFACEFCDHFTKGYDGDFFDPGSGPECDGPTNASYLKTFPFDNGCKHHSKRRVESENLDD